MADLSNELDLNVPAAPSLTLDAAPAAPTLTLDPAADEKVIAESKKATPVQVEDTPLSPEEQKMVNDFARKSTSRTPRWSCSTALPARRS